MDSDYEEIITAAPKKRNKNEHLYKRNIIKKARVSGEAYVAHNGRQVPRVSYGSGCRQVRYITTFNMLSTILNYFITLLLLEGVRSHLLVTGANESAIQI